MIELADITKRVFTTPGLTYRRAKYRHGYKRVRLKQEMTVSPMNYEAALRRGCSHTAVIVFDRCGCMMRKLPDANVVRSKGKCRAAMFLKQRHGKLLRVSYSLRMGLTGTYDARHE